MVGASILNKLKNNNNDIYTIERNSLDLLDQTRVFEYFYYSNFDLVIDCAAKVGGIYSNNT